MTKIDLNKIASNLSGVKPTPSHNVRVAGKIEFVKDTGPIRRDIRVKDFEWSPDAFRDLAKILWASQRSHSFAMAAYKLLSRMPSSQFSPDGLLGGRGYIQSIKDMRSSLAATVEALSSITDTIHDEVNADHWAPQAEDDETSDLVQSTEDVKSNPEAYVESEFLEEGNSDGFNDPVQNPDPEELNPVVEDEEEDSDQESEESEDEEYGQFQTASHSDTAILKEVMKLRKGKGEPDVSGSQLPGSGSGEQGEAITAPEAVMHTVTPDSGSYASAIANIIRKNVPRTASAGMPSGLDPLPRVNHIGPGAGNEAGHFNNNCEWPSDDLNGDGISDGVNESKHLYEDWTIDGVTGYDNPTDGDSSVLQIASHVAAANTYSLLPGSANEKNFDYYARGLSDEDIAWMHANAAPNLPPDMAPKAVKPDTKFLWEVDF